jgi:hypothetical protein
METITYSQIEDLVRQLPARKLRVAYRLLADLTDNDTDSSSAQEDFMLLPLAERRRLLAEQAEKMVSHYEQTTCDREAWQAGDFVEN